MVGGPTLYSEIFDAALSKLKDYDLFDLSQEDCYTILLAYLRPACVKFRVCRQNLKNRCDTLQSFNIQLTDDEIEILANEVAREYISANYIKTQLLLKTALPSRDFSSFSNANHLDKLLDLHKTLKKDNEQLISQYSWSASGLFGGGRL